MSVIPDICPSYGHHLKLKMVLNMIKDLLEPVFLHLNSKDLEGRLLKLSSLCEHKWRQQRTGNEATNGTLNGLPHNGFS